MLKEKFSTRVLAEIAIFAALGFALDVLQGGIFKGLFPNGGSIGIAMVPVFIIAYRRGLLPGVLCGLILSLVQMLGGVYVINGASYDNGFMKVMGPFFQIMLDYVLAYTVVGVAGAFSGLYKDSEDKKMKIIWIIVGTVIGGLLKYACHVASGAWFWLDPSITFWGVNGGTVWYSFVYNGAYCIPNIILSTAVIVLLAYVYPQFLDPKAKALDFEDDVEEVEVVEEVNESTNDDVAEEAKEEVIKEEASNEEKENN